MDRTPRVPKEEVADWLHPLGPRTKIECCRFSSHPVDPVFSKVNVLQGMVLFVLYFFCDCPFRHQDIEQCVDVRSFTLYKHVAHNFGHRPVRFVLRRSPERLVRVCLMWIGTSRPP